MTARVLAIGTSRSDHGPSAAINRISACEGSWRLSGICTASVPPGREPAHQLGEQVLVIADPLQGAVGEHQVHRGLGPPVADVGADEIGAARALGGDIEHRLRNVDAGQPRRREALAEQARRGAGAAAEIDDAARFARNARQQIAHHLLALGVEPQQKLGVPSEGSERAVRHGDRPSRSGGPRDTM